MGEDESRGEAKEEEEEEEKGEDVDGDGAARGLCISAQSTTSNTTSHRPLGNIPRPCAHSGAALSVAAWSSAFSFFSCSMLTSDTRARGEPEGTRRFPSLAE